VKPVLLVTNHVPPARAGAFAALARRVDLELALFGGRARHGGLSLAGEGAPPTGGVPRAGGAPLPVRRISQRGAFALAAGGDYGAVVAGTVGRTALPAAYLGARRARVPFVLWATLWAQPGGPAGRLGYPAVRWVYGHADAVATYGPHVSAYVTARGARRVHDAPQAVDADFWEAPAPAPERRAPFQVLFAGRLEAEKGVASLLEAWRALAPAPADAALVLAGDGPLAGRPAPPGVAYAGALGPQELRNFYGGSDVVVVPSIPTRTFREPWGMVVNEAMHQGLPVIATDAVGAAAGGLVRDGRNGLVVPAGDPPALAAALAGLREDPAARARLGAAAREDVRPYTQAAWAEGMSRAIADATDARTGGG
jgi:glycosyltransferase involved in cell wall biosynthesis